MSRNTDKVAQSIGHLVLAFQDLEANLLFLLAGLFERKDVDFARILAGQLPYRKMLDTLDAIFRRKVHQKSLLERVQSIVSTCSRLEEKRNTYVHSHYHFADIVDAGTRIQRTKEKIKRGRGHLFLRKEYDPDELDQVLESIYAVIDEIDELIPDLEKSGLASFF